MKKRIQDAIAQRIAEINAAPAEALTEAEAASLAAAEAMDDGTAVSLEECRRELEERVKQ